MRFSSINSFLFRKNCKLKVFKPCLKFWVIIFILYEPLITLKKNSTLFMAQKFTQNSNQIKLCLKTKSKIFFCAKLNQKSGQNYRNEIWVMKYISQVNFPIESEDQLFYVKVTLKGFFLKPTAPDIEQLLSPLPPHPPSYQYTFLSFYGSIFFVG